MHRQLWRLNAAELAAHVRHGELSALEVVEAHLDRVTALNRASILSFICSTMPHALTRSTWIAAAPGASLSDHWQACHLQSRPT
jgi:Asp-tRNA(Asn)/Glu-tRNA(Gln) amidotransferase A subunit family amidase